MSLTHRIKSPTPALRHARVRSADAYTSNRGQARATLPVHLMTLVDWILPFLMIPAAVLSAANTADWLGRLGATDVEQWLRMSFAVAVLFFIFRHSEAPNAQLARLNRSGHGWFILKGWVLSCVVLALFVGLSGAGIGVSPTFAALAFTYGIVALLGAEVVHRLVMANLIATGLAKRQKAVVIGGLGDRHFDGNSALLRRNGIRIVNHFSLPSQSLDTQTQRAELQELINSIVRVLEEHSVDEILVAGQLGDRRMLDDLLTGLRDIPLPVRFVPDAMTRRYVGGRMSMIGRRRVFELQRAPLSMAERVVKRSFDIVGALTALVVFSPLLFAVAVMIKLDSTGPVFFRQRRVGFCGRAFRIYKFRSMTTMDDGNDVRQATANDQRVTRVGRWLRSSSIDELPQLLNVLSGEMSLIGPRPHARAHHELYLNAVAGYALRHHVKPGITGWAQANGYRGETPTIDLMEKRIQHDIWYIRHWSFWLDVRTIMLTVKSLFGTGRAY